VISPLPKITEEALQKDGFKKIKSSYGGRCSYCGQPYAAGEEIYWKRDPVTRVCCSHCFGAISKKKVICPNCGMEFEVD